MLGVLMVSSFSMGVLAVSGLSEAEAVQDPAPGLLVPGGTSHPTADLPFLSGRPATLEDVEGMKARYGVSSPGYEVLLTVDGHGTGLTPPTEEQWLDMVGELMVYEADEAPSEVPGQVDLSSDPAFPAVGNQQSQGSCGAWAATYYSYGYLEAVDRGWTEASLGTPEQLLSPAWTYNMVNAGKDRGSWIDTNMMVIRDWGATTMALMPYDQYDVTRWGSPEAFREAPLHRALEVGYLEYSHLSTVEAVKALVAGGTPVAFAMDASMFTPSFSDGNFIVSSYEYSSTALNHAQTIVGYDDSVADDSDVGAFRVVNSWGSDWGDSGYYWFTYAAIEELGGLDCLVLNFIVDIEDYEPSLLAVWHFNDAPYRDAGVTLGVGPASAPTAEKSPYYEADWTSRLLMPTFMCLDMTEHEAAYWSSAVGMYITIGDTRTDGTLSSFRMESYEPPHVRGAADRLSEQSSGVPASTPCTVYCKLEMYGLMSVDEALDLPSLVWASGGQAAWVPVDHHSSGDGDSMQAGDISDGSSSTLEAVVEGPAVASFDWMVSSQAGKDVLGFSVDGTLVDQISGAVGWLTVTVSIDEGEHALAWTYAKDSSISSSDDSGWVDSLRVVSGVPEPPQVSLEDSYEAAVGQAFAVQPSVLLNPSGLDLTATYDWGDSSEWTSATEEDSYGATHVYEAPGTYQLRVYVTDGVGNNVTDGAEVHVQDMDGLPSFVGASVDPEGIVLPGTTVSFELTVTDREGGTLTVYASFGDGSPDQHSSASVAPGGSATVEFTHVYTLGSDTPYQVAFEVRDEEDHPSGEWDRELVDLTVNSPPTAVLAQDELQGEVAEAVVLDASGSTDAETEGSGLAFRWDWEGDGVWDTPWSGEATGSHSYLAPGVYEASVEVRDAVGQTSTASATVTVTGEAIPEFSTVVLPVAGLLLVLVIVRSVRRR